MDKRTFLKTTALLTAGFLIKPNELLLADNQGITEFTLPKLPYSYDALEPHIDKMTMEIHHSKHHQTYINKLNEAIKDTKYKKDKIEDILEDIEETNPVIRNNAGGHYNHSLFWTLLIPKAPTNNVPSGKLADMINAKFNSFDNFKELFTNEALNRFGAGWVWLNLHKKNGLTIVSTANQDNPLMTSIYKDFKHTTPLLCLDVWEHAYYLKYQNKRAEYVKAFWNIVNWEEVAKKI